MPNFTVLLDSKNDKIVKSEQSETFGNALRSSFRKSPSGRHKKCINVSYLEMQHSEFVTDWFPVECGRMPPKRNQKEEGEVVDETTIEEHFMEFLNDSYVQTNTTNPVLTVRESSCDMKPFTKDFIAICRDLPSRNLSK